MSDRTVTVLVVLGVVLSLAAVMRSSRDGRGALDSPGVSVAPDATLTPDAESPSEPALVELDPQATRLEASDAVTEAAEVTEATDVSSMTTEEDMYSYVKSQEPWAADDSTFEDKYSDMTVEQMFTAESLVGRLHKEEQTDWLETMDLDGDYTLLTDDELGKPFKPELFGGAFSMRMRDGLEGPRRYVFTHENYPFVQMRAREQRWLLSTIIGKGGNPARNNTHGSTVPR